MMKLRLRGEGGLGLLNESGEKNYWLKCELDFLDGFHNTNPLIDVNYGKSLELEFFDGILIWSLCMIIFYYIKTHNCVI